MENNASRLRPVSWVNAHAIQNASKDNDAARLRELLRQCVPAGEVLWETAKRELGSAMADGRDEAAAVWIEETVNQLRPKEADAWPASLVAVKALVRQNEALCLAMRSVFGPEWAEKAAAYALLYGPEDDKANAMWSEHLRKTLLLQAEFDARLLREAMNVSAQPATAANKKAEKSTVRI